LFAASRASVGVATLVIVKPPISIVDVACPNPLSGMFDLSNLALVTEESDKSTLVIVPSNIFPVVTASEAIVEDTTALGAMSTVAIDPSNIVVELTESVARVGAVATPVSAPAKIIVPEIVDVANGVVPVI
jgi:hypothetical protein